eukprot:3839026-Alexandrium_andersonii.AAC.1
MFEVRLPDTETGSDGFIFSAERIGQVSLARVKMLLFVLGRLDGPTPTHEPLCVRCGVSFGAGVCGCSLQRRTEESDYS